MGPPFVGVSTLLEILGGEETGEEGGMEAKRFNPS